MTSLWKKFMAKAELRVIKMSEFNEVIKIAEKSWGKKFTAMQKDELKERYKWNDFCTKEAVEVVFQYMTGVCGECLILREKILELAEKHDLFNKQAVSRTVSQNYSDICGLRRTYHLMMSAIYGARPEKPYFFDICK